MQLVQHKYIHAGAKARRILSALHPEEVRSIAVIKHAALGDMVLARPFFVTLRRHFPNASLTASVIDNYTHGVPEDLVDRVHVCAGRYRPRPPFLARLKSYRALGYHDLIFDISAGSESYWVTLVNKARLKIGYWHRPHARFLYDIAIPRQIFKFEAENFLDQLGALRLSYDWPLDFGFPPPPGKAEKPYLVYFPTASTPVKCWPAERYGSLMGRLAESRPDFEHRLVYGVADWETAVADSVMEAARAESGGRGNLIAWKDLHGDPFRTAIQQATLLVGNDTGVRNFAIALGTPTLGIFPVSFVETYLPRFGHHAVVQEAMGGHPGVERVLEAALKLLGEIEG